MLIGYSIVGEDNDTFMFDNATMYNKCSKCGIINDKTNTTFLNKLNKRYDFSYTYDGCCIVSKKFKEFCYKNNYKGIKFKEISNAHDYFLFVVDNVLKFDVVKSNIKFEKFCNVCKRYYSITPAYPIILNEKNKVLKDSFYRTDIEFGSGNEQSPVIIIGIETWRKLKKNMFSGLYAEKIYSIP